MVSYKITGLVLCVVVYVAHALPAQDQTRVARNAIQTEDNLLESIYTDCLHTDTVACMKLRVFSLLDKMANKGSVTVIDGVQFVKTSEPSGGAPRALTSDDSIEGAIFSRITSFLETHTIKVDLKGSEIVDGVTSAARSFSDAVETYSEEDNAIDTEEGRGKKKKAAKILGPLMAIAALKTAILGKLAIGVIALIAAKALVIAKIALVISLILGVKKLLSGQQGKQVTYEVVSHPQHSSSHVSSHESVYGGGDAGGGDGGYSSSSHGGGWGRSMDQLAYRGHKQGQNQ